MKTLDRVFELCATNEARNLIRCVMNLVHVWDDAIDGEKKQSDNEINTAFGWALFASHNDAFLQRNPSLWLSLNEMVVLWMAANKLEKEGTLESLRQSYVLRCSPYNFCCSVVGFDAGMEAAVEAAALLYGDSSEDSFEDYVQDHLRR